LEAQTMIDKEWEAACDGAIGNLLEVADIVLIKELAGNLLAMSDRLHERFMDEKSIDRTQLGIGIGFLQVGLGCIKRAAGEYK
jgi:hypothetical protein